MEYRPHMFLFMPSQNYAGTHTHKHTHSNKHPKCANVRNASSSIPLFLHASINIAVSKVVTNCFS